MKKALLATILLATSVIAQACPAGTHPVCVYDPYQGRSVCHCV